MVGPPEGRPDDRRSLADGERPGHRLREWWRGRDDPEQMVQADDQDRRVEGREGRRHGSRPTRRERDRWLAPEETDPAQGVVLEPGTGVAIGPVQDESGAELGFGVLRVIERAPRSVPNGAEGGPGS